MRRTVDEGPQKQGLSWSWELDFDALLAALSEPAPWNRPAPRASVPAQAPAAASADPAVGSAVDPAVDPAADDAVDLAGAEFAELLGTFVWTTPAGRVYTAEPDRYAA